MSRFTGLIRKPAFILAVVLSLALIAEFILLEGFVGISLPTERGTAISSFEIREKGRELHFITRNKRFTIVEDWSQYGDHPRLLVLRESFVMDRKAGVEGAQSVVKVEAFEGSALRWSVEESGERGEVRSAVYEITKFGCCDAPNRYTYFSLRDGKKLLTTPRELNGDETVALGSR